MKLRIEHFTYLRTLIVILLAGCSGGAQKNAEQPIVLKPPSGETFATGHWDGDKWHRTVPPEPETLTFEGEALTLYNLFMVAGGKKWEESVPILKRIIAEAPYSETAYYARLHLATHDENGKRIYNNALLLERLQPLLNYHPDSPGLLYGLLRKVMHSHPEAAIRYGKEALKYVGMYRMNSGYGEYPERIHHFLGYAYQEIGDYSTTLEHLNQALKLYKANPDRTRWAYLNRDLVKQHIDRILEGNPVFGPLSKKNRPGTAKKAPEGYIFSDFLSQLHHIATEKPEKDFEQLFMQEMVKQLRKTQPDTQLSVSSDRMKRASQIFRRYKTSAEGLKQLQKVDPDLANTIQQLRRYWHM